MAIRKIIDNDDCIAEAYVNMNQRVYLGVGERDVAYFGTITMDPEEACELAKILIEAAEEIKNS